MKLAKFVKYREEKFGGVLFETRAETVYTLNPTAAAVVRAIQAGTPEDQIVPGLAAAFCDADGKLANEVETFLAHLRRKGLVEDDG